MSSLIHALSKGVPAALTELRTLGRTLKRLIPIQGVAAT